MADSPFIRKVRKWIDNIIYTSEYTTDYILTQYKSLDYSFGWRDMIEVAVSENIVSGLLITGPDGCGKHTALTIALHSLVESDDNYSVIRICNEDFNFDETDIQQDKLYRNQLIETDSEETITDDIAHTYLENLLNEFSGEENSRNLCLVLENISSNNFAQQIYRHIEQYICMYSVYKEELPKLFVIIIEPDEKSIPRLLNKHLRLIKVSLPNEEKRRLLFTNKNINKEFIEELASATDGFTYAELENLADNINLYKYTYENISFQKCMEMLEEQSENNIDGNSTEIMYSARCQLYKKIEELIDSIPNMIDVISDGIKNIPKVPVSQGNVVKDTTVEHFEYDSEKSRLEEEHKQRIADIEQESENMTFGSLIEVVLGKETVSEILNN